MTSERQFVISSLAGEHLGTFDVSVTQPGAVLKQQFEEAGGPPVVLQRLCIAGSTVADHEPFEQLELPEDGSIAVTLVLTLDEPSVSFSSKWLEVPESSSLLEELIARDVSTPDCQRRQPPWPLPPTPTVIPRPGIKCVGMDPDSGLLVVVGVGDDVLVIPSDGDPVGIPVPNHPLLPKVVEIHAAESLQGYPLPSMGVAIALVPDIFGALNSPLRLFSFELSAGFLAWTSLGEHEGTDCEACGLDRSASPPRALAAERHTARGRWVVAYQLRPRSSQKPQELFCIPNGPEGAATRVSSIAWSSAPEGVLLTFTGNHSVCMYQKHGSSGWHLTCTIGEPCARGCQDGPFADVRFWFPSHAERLVEHPHGRYVKDFTPLLPGPQGEVLVYSGGVLMKLDVCSSSARKVSSMREELWMTDADEGAPEFPTVCAVFGVHQGSVYRSLTRTDYREEVLVRRLQMSEQLRRGRSQIRRDAPRIWPNITETRCWDAADPERDDRLGVHQALRPAYYHESDVDKWDGDCRWLTEDFLWEGCPPPAEPFVCDPLYGLKAVCDLATMEAEGRYGKGIGKGRRVIIGKGNISPCLSNAKYFKLQTFAGNVGDQGLVEQPLLQESSSFKSLLEIEAGMAVRISRDYHAVMSECRAIGEIRTDSDVQARRRMLGAVVIVVSVDVSKESEEWIEVRHPAGLDGETVRFAVRALASNVRPRVLSALEQAEVDAIHNERWSEVLEIRRQIDEDA